MRVPIPDNIKPLIEKHRSHGDFVAISKRLTKNEENPEGDETRSVEVSGAVRSGSGSFDVVKEISLFYTEKEQAINELNKIGNNVKAAS